MPTPAHSSRPECAPRAATGPRFTEPERRFLLLQRGIGPGVLAHLERRGIDTIAALGAWVERAPVDRCPQALASRRDALARAVAVWPHAHAGAAAAAAIGVSSRH